MGCRSSSLQRANHYERLRDDAKVVPSPSAYIEDMDFEAVAPSHATFAAELGAHIDTVRAGHMKSLRENMVSMLFSAIDKDKCYAGARTLNFGVIFSFPSMFAGDEFTTLASEVFASLATFAATMGFFMSVFTVEQRAFLRMHRFKIDTDEVVFSDADDLFLSSPATFFDGAGDAGGGTERLSSGFRVVMTMDGAARASFHPNPSDTLLLNSSMAASRSQLVHSVVCSVCEDDIARGHGSACMHVCVCRVCAERIIADNDGKYRCPLCRVQSRAYSLLK